MLLENLYEKITEKKSINKEEAFFLLNLKDNSLEKLFLYASKIREKFCGHNVHCCSIVNAKSGKCSEDCSFCAQSAHNKAESQTYPLLSKKELLKAFAEAEKSPASCFSIVTSGKGVISEKEFEIILEVLKEVKWKGKSASLGIISKEQALKLKEVGLEKYHHNLETAESFFPKMCTTHSYQDRLQTVLNVKDAGLKVCCGGIFGLGESNTERVELAMAIKDLRVDSVPLNFIHALKGTKIYRQRDPIKTTDIFKIIAMFRFILPDMTIGVMGGREKNLKEHQGNIFKAGANSILIGNYLVTSGNQVEDDLNMIKKAGLKVKV